MEVDANDVFKPIIERLKQLIQELAMSHPSCFILQGPWHAVRDTLSSCLDLKDSQQRAVLDDLTARNARLALKTNHQGENRNRSVREKLISVLDIAQAPYNIGKLSAEALRLFDSEYWLVRTVVEWSSTIFRAGKTRIYLAVRLLRHWQRKGVDTDSPILDILADSQCQQHLHASHLFQLISELARSRTFAVGRYLQWLMARGALNGDAAQNVSIVKTWCENMLTMPSNAGTSSCSANFLSIVSRNTDGIFATLSSFELGSQGPRMRKSSVVLSPS
jgi:mediator of RNA polymerase II transcription subunit 12